MAPTTQPVAPPSLTIPARFCGPPGSGNGGYVCGAVASYADGPVTVTLRQPPPLDAPMAVEVGDAGSLRVVHDGILIAEAVSSAHVPVQIPRPVSIAQARAAAGRSRYFDDPLFPDCFVCGQNRQQGDGLRIFPGLVPGRKVWAAPWTPDSSVVGADARVLPEIAWAALDCPSGIAAAEDAELGQDTAILLGRMTASVTELPVSGAECLVIAWPGRQDGRKLTAGSALLDSSGQVLAAASATWIAVPRTAGGIA